MKKLLISCLFILLMSANDAMASEVIPFTVYKDGHAWVIDGYQQLNRQRHFTITAVNKKTGQEHIVRNEYYTENITLLHNNWGWGGYLNNWFTAGNFNTGDPSNLVITRSSVYPSYKYELTIYPNIRPIIQ